MKDYRLTKGEVIELRRVHRTLRVKREADRIKAIYLLGLGKSPSEVAEVLMLEEDTVRSYWQQYREGGIEQLLRDEYEGSDGYLTEVQLQQLEADLEATTYLTVESIIKYVQERYGIVYSDSGMREVLVRLGFVYKKAKIVPGKPNRELQEAYVENLVEVLKNKGKNDPHYYLDGVHPQHNTMASYGWIKRGEDKLIQSNTGRQRININGALNVEKLEVVIRTDDTINTQSTIELFRQIEAKHPKAKAIYMNLYNSRY
jgi:transposase